MTEARKAAILEKLRGGMVIRPYLRRGGVYYRLAGISNLRDSEVERLLDAGYLEAVPNGRPFSHYRLKQLATVFKEHGV